MKRTISTVPIFIFCISAVALGQKGRLEGYVTDDIAKPVADVRVAVSGAEEVTTDSDGHFTAMFPRPVKPGSPIKILVLKENWVVFKPMFGNYIVPDEGTNAELLPITIVARGSPLSLETDRLFEVTAAMRANLQLSLLSKPFESPGAREGYIQYVKEKFLREYANEYGIDFDKLTMRFDELTRINESGDKMKEAQQQYLLKNYPKSGQLALEAAEDDTRRNQARRREIEAKRERKEADRESINRFMTAGFAFYEGNQLRQTLVPINKLSTLFDTGEFSKDDFAVEWGRLQLFSGLTKSRLGLELMNAEGIQLQNEGLTAFRQAESIFTYDKSPQNWLRTQVNLGVALTQFSNRVGGTEGARALQDAVGITRRILEISSFEKSLPDWVKIQNNLGNQLVTLGSKLDEVEGMKLINEAIAIHRSVLKAMENSPEAWTAKDVTNCVCNVEDFVQIRAKTQNYLGNALEQLSALGGGTVSSLEEAAENYRLSQAVNTREKSPHEWSSTSANLSYALIQLGTRVDGGRRIKVLEEAVRVSREPVKIYSVEKTFQLWTRSRTYLGNALVQLGAAKGAEGLQDLTEAIDVYRSVLREFERSPQTWASTESNPCHCFPEEMAEARARVQIGLGSALLQLAVVSSSRIKTLEDAVDAYRSALKFYELKKRPQDLAFTQTSLSSTLVQWAANLGGTDRVRALEEAVDLSRQALKVYSFEKSPQRWARAENYLGSALTQLATTNGSDRVHSLEEAVDAHRAALLYYDLQKSPSDWALTQNALGDALLQLSTDKGDSGLLEATIEAYRSALKVYTFETSPLEWARANNYLGSALTRLAIPNGSVRVKSLEEAANAHRAALRYYDLEKSPSDWALTQSYLGDALIQLSTDKGDSSLLEATIEAYRSALKVYTFETSPLEWARANNYLGSTLTRLAIANGAVRVKSLEEAIGSHRAALRYYDLEKSPSDWALTQTTWATHWFS